MTGEGPVVRSEPRPGVVRLTLSRPGKLKRHDLAAGRCPARPAPGHRRRPELPGLVGAGRAHELMLVSRRFDAAEALAMGLVTDVAEPGALADRVEATIDALLRVPPLSLQLTKHGMWLALEIPSFDAAVELENRQQVLASATADAREAGAAYRQNRPPAYRNA